MWSQVYTVADLERRGEGSLGYLSMITGSLQVGRSVSNLWSVGEAPLVIVGPRCKTSARSSEASKKTKPCPLLVKPGVPCAPLNLRAAGLCTWAA